MTNTDLIERLRAINACDSECQGRCKQCPNEVIREAIAALESRPVAVRKLEWLGLNLERKIEPYGWAFAETVFGRYEVSDHGANWTHDRFTLTYASRLVGRYASDVAAFTAAQADFDQRIRSVIEPSPEIEAPAAGEAEAVAWQYEELYVGRGGETNWHLRFSVEKPTDHRPDVRSVEPLYLHPAPLRKALEKVRKTMMPFAHAGEHVAFYVPEGLPSDDDLSFPKRGTKVYPGEGPIPFSLTLRNFSDAREALAKIDAALTGQPVAGDGVEKAAEELCAACEEEFVGAVCADEPDDEPIAKGEYGHHSLVTFGMIRRLRAALAAHKG